MRPNRLAIQKQLPANPKPLTLTLTFTPDERILPTHSKMEVQYFTFDKTYLCEECKERKCEEEFKHGGYFDLEDKDFICRVCWKDDSDAEDESLVPDWVLEQRAEEVEARYSWDEEGDTDLTSPLPKEALAMVSQNTPDSDTEDEEDDSDAETEVFAGLEEDDAKNLSYKEPPRADAYFQSAELDTSSLPPPPADWIAPPETYDCGCPASKNNSTLLIDPTDNCESYICAECRDEYIHAFQFRLPEEEEEEQAPTYDYPTGDNNPQKRSFAEFIQWFKENVEDLDESTPDEVSIGCDIVKDWCHKNNHIIRPEGVFNLNIECPYDSEFYLDLCVQCETANITDKTEEEAYKLANGRWRCFQCAEEHGTKPSAILLGHREPFENEVWKTPEQLREMREKAERLIAEHTEEQEKKREKLERAYGSADEEIVERRRTLKYKIREFEDLIHETRKKQDRPNWFGKKPLKNELSETIELIMTEERMRGDGFVLRWKDAIEQLYKDTFGVAKTQTQYKKKSKGVFGDKTDEIFKFMGFWEDEMDAMGDWVAEHDTIRERQIKSKIKEYNKYINDKRRKIDEEAKTKWSRFATRLYCSCKTAPYPV